MTNRLQQLPRRDIERLSAYLDGELSTKEAANLEARLAKEPGLQAGLQELRQASRLLADLPQQRVPRSFALSPEMVGQQERGWRYPIMQLATAVAAFAFLVVIGFDAVTSQGLLAGNLTARTAQEAPLAQEAAPEMLMESADQAEVDEAMPAEAPAAAELSEAEQAEALGASEPEIQEEAMEAETQPTPSPAGTERSAVDDQLQAEQEQERVLVPSATPVATAEMLPTQAPGQVEPPPGPSGFVRNWLRWLEIGLAALVIVLAGLTLRLRPG
jgi:anti-sigma factor RsiW